VSVEIVLKVHNGLLVTSFFILSYTNFTQRDPALDLFLMHNYTLRTSLTFVTEPKQIKPLQEWCPDNVVEYPFLLHAILSFSAFHVAHNKPDEKDKWADIGLKHKQYGLVAFRNGMQAGPTEQNCHALFAQCLLLSCASFAASAYAPLVSDEGKLDIVLEPFMHVRGAGDLVLVSYWNIRQGPLSEMLPNNFLRVEGNLATPLDERLSKMKKMIKERYKESPAEIHLLGAIEALRFVYKETSYAMSTWNPGTNRDLNHPKYHWKWPNLVNQSYIALLRKHNPVALIIFAHFAVLSSEYDNVWYFHGWAERAIVAVEETLPADYQEWLNWPKEQIDLGLPAFKDPVTRATPVSSPSIANLIDEVPEKRCSGAHVETTFMDMKLIEKARYGA
jgi:hypothetical protein